MSIRIRIGQDERELAQADEHWIISRIKQEEANQGSVCVRVIIKGDCVDMVVSSGGCAAGGGGGRQANAKEREIFELWDKFGMNANDLVPGKVNAFLKQIRRIA